MKTIEALGIDITEEYVQASFVTDLKMEPESYSQSTEAKEYLVPAVMYFRENNNTWYIGEEANYNAKVDKKSTVLLQECIENDDEKLSIFIEILIEKVKKYAEADNVKHVCLTTEEIDLNSQRIYINALEKAGFNKSRIRIINHDEALLYYSINQPKELSANDVVLFDFTKNHMYFRRIHEQRNITPHILEVTSKDLSDDIYYEMLSSESGRIKADRQLLEFVQTDLRKLIITTIYLTGEGFYDQWATESLQEMCDRRRVFMGYNLFVKGACYCALKKARGDIEKKHIFKCSGRTKASVGIFVDDNGKNTILPLSDIGCNWYEAGAQIECVLDGVSCMNLILTAPGENRSVNKIVDLKEFPKRPPKTTRISITLSYKDDDKLELTVKDMGFGELYKSSGKQIKSVFSIKEELDL